MTQNEQVINAMRKNGGFATLKRLNETVDFSDWRTKTPEASVRRIVQTDGAFFRIEPGLWALKESEEEILKRFNITPDNKQGKELFSHGYYQGLLVEIGKFKKYTTYVPAQDKNRIFIDRRLEDISDITDIPNFTYERITRRARTVDVIWFNSRQMPEEMYEVEHTTDIKNSLLKFYELQDFYSKFHIVADKSREREFEDKLSASIFDSISKRVKFLNYDRVAKEYNGLKEAAAEEW